MYKIILADGTLVSTSLQSPVLEEHARQFPGEPYWIADPRVTSRGICSSQPSIEGLWAAEFLGCDTTKYAKKVALILDHQNAHRMRYIYFRLFLFFQMEPVDFADTNIRKRFKHVPRMDFLPPRFVDETCRELHSKLWKRMLKSPPKQSLDEISDIMFREGSIIMSIVKSPYHRLKLRDVVCLPEYTLEGRLKERKFYTDEPMLGNIDEYWVRWMYSTNDASYRIFADTCIYLHPDLQQVQQVWFK